MSEEAAKKPVKKRRSLTEQEQLRARNKQLSRHNSMLREELALKGDLRNALAEQFAAQPVITVTPPLPQGGQRRARTLILFLSDIHVGQLFKRASNGGLGNYDLEEFEVRCNRLAQKMLAITSDIASSGPVDRCVVVFGGDMVDGRTIHPGHDHESEGIASQLRIGPEVIAQVLMRQIANAFSRVDVFSVPGNHGRLGKKGELHRVEDSLDTVFMDILKVRCEAMPNITWHPWNQWFQWFKLHGHTYFVAHGDAFKSWLGIPYYGAQRYKARIESLVNSPVDVMMVGHHHSPAHWTQAFSNVVMNGSWVGTSEFGSWLGMGGQPVQKMILVSEDYAAATTYDLILSTRDEMLTTTPVEI